MSEPDIHPTLLEVAQRIGAMKIDDFPTTRAARLASELLEEANRLKDERTEARS